MSQKSFCLTAGVIFSLIALGHLLRLLQGWEVVLAGWPAPAWLSWAAVVVSGFLAYEGFRASRKG